MLKGILLFVQNLCVISAGEVSLDDYSKFPILRTHSERICPLLNFQTLIFLPQPYSEITV